MSLSVVLKSRKVRKAFTDTSGTRVIGKDLFDSPKGALGKIKNALIGFGKWAIGKLWTKIRSVSLLDVYEWIANRVHDLWTFDWNVTDSQLDQKTKEAWEQVKVAAAGLAGRAVGYLVCGALPALSIAVFNEALGAYLLKKFGEEAVTELAHSLAEFLKLVAKTAAVQFIRFLYKSGRRMIKAAARNPLIRKVLTKGGIDTKKIDEWGEKSEKDASFASRTQRKIENLPETWQDSAEEFIDELGDACFEGGYIIAGGLDEFFSMQANAKDVMNPLGRDRIVRFTPNKDVKDEQFVLAGKEEFLKAEMIRTINQSQIIDNREVTLSLPTEEWGRIPVTENGAVEIEFEFYRFEEGPYWTNERRKDNGRQRIHLYNVNKSTITFDKLWRTFRKIPFKTGDVKTTVTWSNGRKTGIWAASPEEGERIAQDLSQFTHEKIVFPIFFSTRKGHLQGQSNNAAKKNHKQYLASIKIWNWDRITKFEKAKGKASPTDRKRLIKKIACNFTTEPSWWKDQVAKALKDTL